MCVFGFWVSRPWIPANRSRGETCMVLSIDDTTPRAATKFLSSLNMVDGCERGWPSSRQSAHTLPDVESLCNAATAKGLKWMMCCEHVLQLAHPGVPCHWCWAACVTSGGATTKRCQGCNGQSGAAHCVHRSSAAPW